MAKITTIEELREAIRDLEHQNYVNEQHMRSRVAQLTERLKPANLIKNLFGHFFSGYKSMLLVLDEPCNDHNLRSLFHHR